MRMNLDDYACFKENHRSLKELSFDSAKNAYVTDKLCDAIDFDKVKRWYCNNHSASEEKAHSVDALMEKDGMLYLIEFKDGDFSGRDIREKVTESLLIFCAITKSTIAFSSKNIEAVLVYNEENKPVSKNEKTFVQESQSKNRIAAILMQKGNEEYIRFGLEKLGKPFVRATHTYTRSEFDAFLG
jgi:hypothetical protein